MCSDLGFNAEGLVSGDSRSLDFRGWSSGLDDWHLGFGV